MTTHFKNASSKTEINERGRVLKVNTQQEPLTKFDVPSLKSLQKVLKEQEEWLNKKKDSNNMINKTDQANLCKNVAKELYRLKQYDLAIDCYYNVINFSNMCKQCKNHEVCPD